MRIAVQIGVNCSNDFFLDICKEEKFDFIYLIEPLIRFNRVIHDCYIDFKHRICNYAISPDKTGVVKLYEFSHEGSQNSLSKRKSHPDRSADKPVNSILVPCTTFNSFCRRNNITEIELLCMDLEGLDDEVLLSIDFDTIHIRKIIWENWDHDDDDENGVFRTGTEIQAETRVKLEKLGYVIGEHSVRDLYAELKEGEGSDVQIHTG